MANTATALTAQSMGYKQMGTQTTPIVVTIDTVDTDLTVFTPGAGNMWAIVGLLYASSNAHTLRIRSGATAITDLELAANSGVAHPLDAGILATGNAAAEALIIQSSAAITRMVFLMSEFDVLVLGDEFDRGD